MEFQEQDSLHCSYSDLPSPMAYMEMAIDKTMSVVSERDLNRIIEMAWEDRTPFEAIKMQFGLTESEVKVVMKRHLRFSSYIRWRKRVENCTTKHVMLRNKNITRFKCSRQRQISQNRISKQKR